MPTPLGVSNPLFEHELAEALHMSVTELIHGRGTPMTAHELCVRQPLYQRYKQRQMEIEEAKLEGRGRR